MQKIVLKAEYSYDRATELVQYFAMQGFSVSATDEGNKWTIAAMRAIDQ